MIVAITGAAGNLGSMLTHGLMGMNLDLNLLFHCKKPDVCQHDYRNIHTYRIDLAKPETLYESLRNVDVVVHFAGILFKGAPEKFLPLTNTEYFRNLLNVAVQQHVKRIILISFPHVEGESTPDKPAYGRLDGNPESIHARTRLEEEQLLFQYEEKYGFEGVSLRVGMVYGKGVIMIDAAQWLARHWLLGVWRKPTYIHLISRTDFISATISAVLKPGVRGIYHLGDEGIQTLQTFLDDITSYRKNKRPWRMPVCMIMAAARISEGISIMFKIRSPLTVDFIKIGMVSYYGDTRRMRKELLPDLAYKTYHEGITLF